MADFILTDINKQAIDILKIAGYKITFGDTIYGDGTKTFSLFVDDNKTHGVSSTRLLTPDFVINQIIKKDSFKKGHNAGINQLQDQFKKLLNIQ